MAGAGIKVSVVARNITTVCNGAREASLIGSTEAARAPADTERWASTLKFMFVAGYMFGYGR